MLQIHWRAEYLKLKIVHGFNYIELSGDEVTLHEWQFDFFQYDGKVNAKEETYQQRSDFYFFETVARKYEDQEIKEYLLASFVLADDPTKVWIGDIKRAGKDNWLVWQRQIQSRSYNFEQDIGSWLNIWKPQNFPLTSYLRHLEGTQHFWNFIWRVWYH